jgi:Delta14-sterol reductase
MGPASSPTTTTTSTRKKKKKDFEYEFGGPVGAGLTMVCLPVIVLLLAHWSEVGEVRWPTTIQVFWPAGDVGTCCGICLAWFLYQVLLERCLPGPLVAGAPIITTAAPLNSTTDGTASPPRRLLYRINGHLALWITLLIVLAGWPTMMTTSMEKNNNSYHHNNNSEKNHPYLFRAIQWTAFPHWSYLYEHFSDLALASIILTTLFSIYLYLSSFWPDRMNGRPKVLATGGNSGVAVYDFWMGRELNPRCFRNSFDWKEFCELRPGLMGWLLLNMASAYQQQQYLGYNTGSMVLINLFQGIYVWDALYQESAILTTMDITTDGFGFMLCFGDLTWVPFTYSIQARYLVRHDPHLHHYQLLLIVGIYLLGYWIFRSSNGQKDLFRRDPDHPQVVHLSYLQTKRGTRLLTSGWWGLARKINYLGDYVMAVSWCLLCGYGSIVPYYYAIYFAVLLIHRSIRDDHMCHEKYGNDWLEYKKKVPYRFIPGIV